MAREDLGIRDTEGETGFQIHKNRTNLGFDRAAVKGGGGRHTDPDYDRDRNALSKPARQRTLVERRALDVTLGTRSTETATGVAVSN